MTQPRPYPGIGQALVLVIAVIVFQVLIGIAIGTLLPAVALRLPLAAAVGLANVLSFGVVIWWGVRRSGLPLSQALPFLAVRPAVYLPLVVMVTGLGIVASEVDNLLRYVLPMPRFVAEIFKAVAGAGAVSLLTLTAIAPVTEELLFRGVILRGFLERYAAPTAVLVSALIFGVVHLNPYQFFSAFVMGSALGWVFLKTGSLVPCIVGHAVYNGHGFIVTALLPVSIPGYNPEQLDLSVVEFQPLWFDAMGVLAVGLGFAALSRLFARGGTALGQVGRTP
ncbi:MAG: type II CAAX endopeptidase family protein [Alphaproteobacteria bacterium]|nr:type II CAAX endopeptidase family protein [Alphaproteobacteria bacterium]